MIPGQAQQFFEGAAGGAGGDFQIDRSLRFNAADSANLTRTFSAGNKQKWTWSGWVKRSSQGVKQHIFAVYSSGNNSGYFRLAFETNSQLFVGLWTKSILTTDAFFRDFSAWYHIVLVLDTNNSTAADQIILYVNGVRQTVTGTADSGAAYAINSAALHNIGAQTSSSQYFDGYLAEINFVDGQALAPTAFGESNADTGVWEPKEFAGTYGPLVEQTRTWSNDLSATSLANATKMFDWTYGYGSYSGTCTWTTTNSAYSGLSGRVYLANNTTVTLGITFKDSGGNTLGSFNLPWTGDGTALQDTSFNWSSSVASVEITGGYLPVRVQIGSLILVDSGVSISSNGFYLKFADNSSNAALGTDSSGNNNTWTVNNLTAAANGVTSFSSTNVTNASNILDGNTGTGAVFSSTNAVFDASCNITGITQLEFLIYDGSGDNKGQMQYRVNGGSYVNASYNNTNTYVWNDATSLLTDGTLTSFGFKLFGSPNGGAKAARYTTSAGTFYITSTPSSDSLLDTPTNYDDGTNVGGNYATLNFLHKGSNATLSNGNLSLVNTGWSTTVPTIGVSSGKWYAEVTLMGTLTYPALGVSSLNSADITSYFGQAADSFAWFAYSSGGLYTAGAYTNQTGDWVVNSAAGDVIGLALDMDNGTLKYYRNGNLLGGGNAFTGITGTQFFATCGYSQTENWNFGQRAFAYPVSGYKALCTTNLAEPLISDPSTAFNVALWTGNNSTQSLTGFAFGPDIFWSKSRSTTWNHGIYDTVRGPNKLLRVDTTGAEYTAAAPNESITSFNSDGVTFGPDGAAATVNYSGTYVGWAWDAGANSNRTYNVTVVSDSGNKYRFNGHGTSAVTLDLAEGSTYVFDSSDSSVNSHPFVLGTSANSNEYSTGVVYTLDGVVKTYSEYISGFAAATTRKLTITIPASAPVLYYFCYYHSGMGGQVNTNSTAGSTVLSGSLNSSVYNQSHDITSNITSSGSLGGTLANWFNGQRANKLEPSGSGSLDFTGVSALQSFSGTLQFAVSAYSGSTSMKFVINASTDNLTFTTNTLPVAAAGFPLQLLTIPVTSLRTLDFTSISAQSTQFWGMYLDGKLLVDSTATPDSIPSVNTIVQADSSRGVSISSYQGTGAIGSFAHGLNANPGMVIVKTRDSSNGWLVWHKSMSNLQNNYLQINTTDAENLITNYWGYGGPSSSTVGIGTSTGNNTNNEDMISWCFSSVENFSLFSSYEGNGSNDGPYVFCGFSPRWLMIKCIDNYGSGYDWFIFDTERSQSNVTADILKANLNAGEYSFNSVDILSNGFKIQRNTNGINLNAHTFIFAAFAEHPFKTARAR